MPGLDRYAAMLSGLPVTEIESAVLLTVTPANRVLASSMPPSGTKKVTVI